MGGVRVWVLGFGVWGLHSYRALKGPVTGNQLDAFANEIQNFVGMIESFLTTISTYAGPKGTMARAPEA